MQKKGAEPGIGSAPFCMMGLAELLDLSGALQELERIQADQQEAGF